MNRLKELRTNAELSARELASRTGMTHTTVTRIEKGERKMSIPQAEKFAQYFNVSVDYLIGRADK